MSPERPLVQFVSKPIVAPFRDGTKCLVRELVTHFEQFDAAVMGTSAGAPELEGKAAVRAVYSSGGSFAPGLMQNVRAAAWLGFERRAALWHFVFAPNPRSSQVGHALHRLRRVPIVQTVASPPRSFEAPGQLLFGDRVVVQSEWTRARFAEALAQAGQSREIRVVPPPAPKLEPVLPEQVEAVRARLGVPQGAPLFLYPGDLEVSQGASRVGELVAPLLARLPSAHFVFAYRDKSVHADEHAQALARTLPSEGVHFEKNVPDIHALVAASTAILFPVEDLYGKVDLPIVLLEAMALGTPVLALDEGPLASLEGAWRAPFTPQVWLDHALLLAQYPEAHAEQVAQGLRATEHHYAPARVAAAYEQIYRELLAEKA